MGGRGQEEEIKERKKRRKGGFFSHDIREGTRMKDEGGRGGRVEVRKDFYTSHGTLVHTLFFFRIISFMRASSTLSRSSCNRRCCSRTVSMVTTHTAVDRARYKHSDKIYAVL